MSRGYLFIFFYISYICNADININYVKLKKALALGFPIAINSIISIVLNFSDRIIMAKFVSLEKIGVYTLAYTGAMLLYIFIFSFEDAWQPMFYNLMDSSNSKKYSIIKKMLTYFTVFISFLCLLGQLFGKEIIIFILPKNYNDIVTYLPYVLGGMVFYGVYHFMANILTYHKNTKIIPLFTFFAAFLNIVLNIIFIPKFGAIAAAITTIISYFVLAISLLIFIKIKYKKYMFNYKKLTIVFLGILNPMLLWLVTNQISIRIFLFKLIYLLVFMAFFYKEGLNFISKVAKMKKA
ncbi:MAG: oligosaccharide flippase family protein [Candidatus Mcinerneyibacterium aminivorans]|uniref:Oligosaccharide flippase family protein n=1 Tax=Candidatus Mcinerneyibacterium aminivorans TaxID=2703815 RepID=A0A5D0MB12_9BACT|nr:MAG: oligosaccharide flippase family protein [Candidatus Mcinerneyibacterium aminivorans]